MYLLLPYFYYLTLALQGFQVGSVILQLVEVFKNQKR